MKYMLLIYGVESPADLAQTKPFTFNPQYAAFNEALAKSGALIAGSRLRPSTQAASVRVRDGNTEVLDGPYAETREQFAGYFLIEAPDMEAALHWAGQCPSAQNGTIEVRPVISQP